MGFSDGKIKDKRGARSENRDPALAALEGAWLLSSLGLGHVALASLAHS